MKTFLNVGRLRDYDRHLRGYGRRRDWIGHDWNGRDCCGNGSGCRYCSLQRRFGCCYDYGWRNCGFGWRNSGSIGTTSIRNCSDFGFDCRGYCSYE